MDPDRWRETGILPSDFSVREIFALRPSPAVKQVFDIAQKMVVQESPEQPITSSFLLFALVQHGREHSQEQKSTTFLAKVVLERDSKSYETCRRNYIAAARQRTSATPSSRNSAEYFSPGARAVFEESFAVGKRTGGTEWMAARHLVAAILKPTGPDAAFGAQRRLKEIGIDLNKLRQKFRDVMISDGPEMERDAWSQLFSQYLSGDTARIAQFNADLAGDRDQLGIMGDVNAMANLIAARELKPPLSIGLFGNWGSGKSFFIDKLDAVIDEIAEQSKQRSDLMSHYWPNIVQVKFNAWNYVDANLWASLVSHLFEQLSRWDLKEQPGPFERARRDAIANLRLAQEARQAALSRKDEATTARDQAKRNKDDREGAVEKDREALVQAMKRDVWDAVRTKLDALDPQLTQHLKDMGMSVDKLQESAQQVYEYLRDATSLAGRIRTLWLTLMADRSLRWPLYAAAAGFLVLLVIAAAMSFGGLNVVALLTGVVGNGAVVLGGLATWIGLGTDQLAKVMKPIYALRAGLDESLRKAEQEKAADIAGLQSLLEQRQTEYQVAVRQLDQAEVAVVAAQASLDEVESGRLISRFIEERVASGDYRKHLGIVATIREDFGKLNQLISGYNDYLQSQDAAGTIEGETAQKTEDSRQGEQLGINRIVLYIDDLDRCPPDRVVEVLQAIHLLLAFPLFVVVVAVDARWVSYALQDQYPHLLVDPEWSGNADRPTSSAASVALHSASPRDYLEKIFQVPYWVQPMDADGCRRLLGHLTSSDLELRASDAAHRGTTPAVVLDGTQLPDVEGPVMTSNVPPVVNRPGVPDLVVKRPGVPAPTVQEPQKTPEPAGLRLEDLEVTAMKELAPLIGRSPREVKRFVNVYRILKAAIPAHALPGFIGTSMHRGDFRFPMLLLAISTGMPRIGGMLMQRISTASQNTPRRPALHQVVKAAKSDTDSGGRSSEWQRLDKYLSANEQWADLGAAELAKWIGRVSQFTFEPAVERWHAVRAGPEIS